MNWVEQPSRRQGESVVAYLGLGSNLGDSRRQIEQAIAEIDRLPATEVLRVSRLYGSRAWGKTDQPDFTNAVVEVQTRLAPRELLMLVKEIEKQHGRERGERWGPRPLDVDILVYGIDSISEPELQVPHPRMWDRAFVLRPLADIQPETVGPDGRTVLERLQDDEIAGQEIWLLDLQ